MRRGIKISLSLLAAFAALVIFTGASRGDFAIGRNIEILVNMFREVNLFYVDEIDPDQLLEDAAAGMAKNLDPYSEFIPEKEMADFEILTTGKYGGIGSLIRKKGDYILIAEPYKGFPADKAGLRIGDKIVEINGQSAKGYDAAKVSSLLKGDPGTSVKLKVEKFYTGQTEELNIRRERIAISGIPYHGFVADSIGYIQHSDFTEDCSEDLLRAFMEMKKTGRLKGLIIDYRNNGGGILQEAVKIMSYFVPKGTEIVSMRGKMKQIDAEFPTRGQPVDLDIPIVLLTNSGSASAAEIVAGSMQDLDRGVLLGQRTFGKGLVQSTRPLGYNSYLKLTTAKYYIPSGRCIQAIDYAHSNEDGSVAFVPDSLIREFTTAGGRKVYDGGGIMPDIRTKPEAYPSRFALVVYSKGYIDDFVDDYLKANPITVDVATYKLGDAAYDAFEKYMEDKSVEFESETKRALADLRRKAERERYLDKIESQLDLIEQGLKDDKKSNLALYRDELSEIIESNIVLRTHYSQGVTQRALVSDKEVADAVALLSDGARYKSIIASKDTDRK